MFESQGWRLGRSDGHGDCKVSQKVESKSTKKVGLAPKYLSPWTANLDVRLVEGWEQDKDLASTVLKGYSVSMIKADRLKGPKSKLWILAKTTCLSSQSSAGLREISSISLLFATTANLHVAVFKPKFQILAWSRAGTVSMRWLKQFIDCLTSWYRHTLYPCDLCQVRQNFHDWEKAG